MFIYTGEKTDFLKSVESDSIAEEIEATIYNKMHRKSAINEFRSWQNSLQYMYKVLNDNDIPDDAGIAIEYNIPLTSKRVDFIITGYNKDNKGKVIIIELKQWDKLNEIAGFDGLVETYVGGGLRQVTHPSYQAWSYATLIKDYNQTVQEDEIELKPCSYLHNYRRVDNDPLDASQYEIYLDDAPAFTRGEVAKLRSFIKLFITKGDQKEVLYNIDSGRIRPSKTLQDSIASMIKGNREFVLIDDQKVIYEKIINISKKSQNDLKKRIIIVEGGPGTGKTVVAINLLSKLTNNNQFCQYVSKNSAPRNVYAKKLKGTLRKSSVDNMFKGSGIYIDVPTNSVDTIIVDEAHRLNSKSGLFHNKGENQIKEIINAGKCCVFFIDESQRVTLKDIGSKDEIEKYANEHGAEIYFEELVSQFRCNGSDGYLSWLDNVLEIKKTANFTFDDIDYDIEIFESPTDIYNIIKEKNKISNHSRMLAGYCWDWKKEGRTHTDYHDIKIDDFEISWNLNNTTTFAIDENSVNEIGCIHTSQGLEFDYVGLIIGEDMRCENGHIVTDYKKRAKSDSSLSGIIKMSKENPIKANKIADEIIKNTYRTLMTRGMKGCYIYCVDKELREYLRQMIKQ